MEIKIVSKEEYEKFIKQMGKESSQLTENIILPELGNIIIEDRSGGTRLFARRPGQRYSARDRTS